MRVLSNLGLCDGASEAELDALVRRYAVQTGGRVSALLQFNLIHDTYFQYIYYFIHDFDAVKET